MQQALRVVALQRRVVAAKEEEEPGEGEISAPKSPGRTGVRLQ
jgi:hypothetical protein